MSEERAPVSSMGRGVLAAYERWAYGEGWIAGLDEGNRRGFDEGYGVGFDAGTDVGASRLLRALEVIVDRWSPDLLQPCRSELSTKSPAHQAEGVS